MGQERVSLSSKTLKSDWSFIVLATSIFIIGLLVSVWDFVQLQKAAWNLGLLDGAGLALFVGGTILRQVGKHALGKNYSYGLRTLKYQKLIQIGIFKYVRHPVTLAALIYTLAIPLVFSSVYGFLVMLLIIPLFLYRIKIEEKMLVEKFGSEYIQYMKRTKRLIPFIY
jgi:protein-S-isoprenylcysteine O-methyltransferase Ste14